METVTNQYLGGDASLACSADTQNEIDRKVVELVKREHEKAKKILLDNRQKLDELSNYLYEKETITGDEFMAILNGEAKKETNTETKIDQELRRRRRMQMNNRRSDIGWFELIVGIILIIFGVVIMASAGRGTYLDRDSVWCLAILSGIGDIVLYVKMEHFTGFGPIVSLVTGI